jgi:hypothetical protein
MKRHTIGAYASQTCEPKSATVNREGGGTVYPTLGGGFGSSAATAGLDTAFGGAAR